MPQVFGYHELCSRSAPPAASTQRSGSSCSRVRRPHRRPRSWARSIRSHDRRRPCSHDREGSGSRRRERGRATRAGTHVIRECWVDGRPIREEYLIVDAGRLAGAGAHSCREGDAAAAPKKPHVSSRRACAWRRPSSHDGAPVASTSPRSLRRCARFWTLLAVGAARGCSVALLTRGDTACRTE